MKYLLYKTWLLALLLIVGAGNVWAEDVTLDFTQIEGFSSWNITYTKHEILYDGIGTVTFASANKQTYTITDMPVTKGGDVVFVATSGKTISSLTFTCEQWPAKAQTITLHTSQNGGKTYTKTSITSTNFVLSASNLTDVNAVKFTFSSQEDQVGIKSLQLNFGGEVETTYDVNVLGDIVNGQVVAHPTSATAGTKIALTAIPNVGYEFASWNVTNASTSETIEVADNEFTMPEAEVNVSATFRELTSASGHLVFGSNGLKINNVSVTGKDDLGNAWTIITEGNAYFGQQATFSQVGSAGSPATSITFSMTLPAKVNVVAFSAKFGGYTDTAGEVTLTVGKATVGTGRLNATEDVTISSTNTAVGNVLTVTVTNIAKGVKCFNVSYTYERIPSPVFTPQIQSFVAQDADEKYFATFSNADDVFMAEGAIVYAVTVEGSRLSLNSNAFEADEVEIDGDVVRGSWIPANTGALLESPGKSVTFYAVANKYLDSQEADNLLRPASVPMETDGSYLFYKLAYGDVEDASTLGFWWGAADGGAYTAKAGAYLAVPKALEANLINGFSFGDDDATGIRTVESAGMPADGKYLRDGRLVIVRAGHEYDVLGIRK